MLLPSAVALLWACLEHSIGPNALGFLWEDLMLPCSVFFSFPAVLRMCALLSSQVLPCHNSSLPSLQVTRAAWRSESITPHISGVDLTAAFKTTLHKKHWNGIYSSEFPTHYPWGDPNRNQSFLQVSWGERGFRHIWVTQKLFSAHFPFDHTAAVDAEKRMYLKWGPAFFFCGLLGQQITYLTKIKMTYLTKMPLQLLTLKQIQCPNFSCFFCKYTLYLELDEKSVLDSCRLGEKLV